MVEYIRLGYGRWDILGGATLEYTYPLDITPGGPAPTAAIATTLPICRLHVAVVGHPFDQVARGSSSNGRIQEEQHRASDSYEWVVSGP